MMILKVKDGITIVTILAHSEVSLILLGAIFTLG